MLKFVSWFLRWKSGASSCVASASSYLSLEQERLVAELSADVSRLRRLDDEAEKKLLREWKDDEPSRTRGWNDGL
jgi:hypothetical protein